MVFVKRVSISSLIALFASCLSEETLNSNSSCPDIEKMMKEERIIKKMPMRLLGSTGLQVSILSYGFWSTFGYKKDLTFEEGGVQKAKVILHACRINGVNFFDNAEVYGGEDDSAEEIMGEAMKELFEEYPEYWKRSQIIVSTKIFWGRDGHENEIGLSRKHIIEGLNESLERLQLDYVDLVFCHRPDPLTPTETVVRAMTDIIRTGKAFYWGTSEWSAQQFTEAYWIAKMYGLEPPCYEQPEYNLFHRQRVEQEYFPLYRPPYTMGTTIYSPLDNGILTGKYNVNSNTYPTNSRAAYDSYIGEKVWLAQLDGTLEKVTNLQDYAKTELNCTVAQLSIAWCCRNMDVSTVILGASNIKQILENLEALNVALRMTKENDAAIEDIINTKPFPYQGFGSESIDDRDWERIEGLSQRSRMRIENYATGFPLPNEERSISNKQ